jgi:hypothetical protein
MCFIAPWKTSKLRWPSMAQALERRLIKQKCSVTLLSKYMGETEQNMAAIKVSGGLSQRAADEADSFCKTGARRSANPRGHGGKSMKCCRAMERYRQHFFYLTTNLLDAVP